jgi:hypothetical protein
LPNGGTRTGSIYDGDVDGWTFTANAGDHPILSLAETGTTSGFSPWLRVIGPNGTVVGSNFGFTTAQVQFNAPTTGTYTVIVGSAGGGFTGSGDYTLMLTGIGAAARVGAVELSRARGRPGDCAYGPGVCDTGGAVASRAPTPSRPIAAAPRAERRRGAM